MQCKYSNLQLYLFQRAMLHISNKLEAILVREDSQNSWILMSHFSGSDSKFDRIENILYQSDTFSFAPNRVRLTNALTIA